MRSLFILSLPRSLSSEVHRVCCATLGLASPAWTTAGEIMNLDRFALQGVQSAAFPKFIGPRHADLYARCGQFLSHAYVPDGFCYKDVVQPFIVSAWLRDGAARPVLKIRPSIPHAALAMLQRRWLYPTAVGRQIGSVPAMMVEGLLMAEAALEAAPGETVAFDDLVDDVSGLERALGRLYPDVTLARVARAPDVERRRDEILARRDLDLYKRLAALEAELRRERADRGGRDRAAAA